MSNTQGAVDWHKSTYSPQNGNCVEQGVMEATGTTAVRDTKDDGTGDVLKFNPSAWTAFVGSLR
jgi:hypothetical protein